MRLVEPSLLIMSFADEASPACGWVLVVHIWIKMSPWVQVRQ